jgi:putative drug exporter of the RND superfamily
MAALARWCFRHRFVVLTAWLLLIVVLAAAGRGAGTAYSNSFTLPGTDSTRALSLLAKADPGQAGDVDTIVWRVSSGTVRDPLVRARISPMLADVGRAPSVASVTSPYSPRGAAQISGDGTIAYATVVFAKQAQDLPVGDIQRVIGLAERARAPWLQVELGGQAIEQANQVSLSASEGIGLAAAAIVLFIAFGSLMAMALPLAVAIAALASGIFSIGLLSHAISIPTFGPELAALIGLGVGIDYALFIVNRHRNAIKAGLSPADAAALALNTSGRAVLFAGATVCIALLGLLVLRLGFLSGLGIAAALVVVCTMSAAVTLLPALLGFLGMRVLSRKERRRLAADGPVPEATSGFWPRWASFIQRWSAPLAVAAAVVMLVLAVPVLSLRLGSSDQGNDPAGSTTRHAYDLLARGFGPGFNGPLQLVATTTGSPADNATLARLAVTLKHQPDVAAVAVAPARSGTGIAVLTVVPASSPEAVATSSLIRHLRASVIPAATRGTGVRVYVGGITAIFADFAAVIGGKLLLFIAVIVGLGFLLLMLAFRSLLIPLTAAVMNLLAAAASFGVVVAVFQFGWGSERLSLGGPGPVESFLPVLMLAILFGLSMDYQVFLVSRMREEWVVTADSRRSVTTGQATTGRVITAAATIMVCVFLAFAFGGQRVIAEFGIGLAAAVLLDAFILRTILVPAAMHLSSRANWWLPGWLDHILPHITVEPGLQSPAQIPTPASTLAAGPAPARPAGPGH